MSESAVNSRINTIETIAVVGAGQMGRGIAQVAAQAGFSVILYDVSSEATGKAISFISAQLDKGVAKEKWDQKTADESLKRIRAAQSLSDLRQAQVVIEAATERKDLKFKLFSELGELVDPKAILATNTSSISITEIAAQTKHPERVVGMHFMNPVPVMKLVEGIKGLETDEEVFLVTEGLAKKMGKTFIKVNDVAGFAINRILMPMINEAVYALYEGVATVEDIDTGMKLGCNMPMGPLELADFIGLDTCLAIMDVLHVGLGDTKYRACPLLRKYVTAGRYGRKSNRGFYQY